MGMGGGEPEVDTSYQDWSVRQAKKARKQEQRREARIDRGMDEIAAIFEGGKVPTMTGVKGAFDPKAKYFLNGKRWRPDKGATVPADEWTAQQIYDAGVAAAGGDDDLTAQELYDLGLQQQAKGSGGEVLSRREQFRAVKGDLKMRGDPKHYAGTEPLLEAREKAMRDYYMPQLRENYGDAKEELTAALANAGLLVSTAANEKRADLTDAFKRERAGVLADIERDIASTRSGINDQRSQIEAALRSSGDASAGAEAALRARKTFAQDAPELNPLANTLLGAIQGIGAVQNGAQVGAIRRATGGGGFTDQSRIVG